MLDMLKNKKWMILLVFAILAMAAFAVVYTGMFDNVRNTAARFFSKPIHSVDDVKNAAGIVEMELITPSNSAILDTAVRQLNQSIADGKAEWPSFTDDAICYEIKYKSGNYTVQGFLCLPDDYLDKEYPVLIYNRGGSNSNSYARGQIRVDEQYSYARMGFIVLATQHRGWGEGSGKDELGGGDVQDVIALVDLAEKFTFSNGKLYMFGWSRGAMETYLVLSRDHRITAAVAGAGPTDISKAYDEGNDFTKVMTIETVGGTPEQLPEEYKKRSALFLADKINTPLLIAQGTDDSVVPMYHSVDLYDKMKALGKDVELKLYEGEDHNTAYGNNMKSYLLWLLEH